VIGAMPRPRPPYLSREVTRHGKPVWYVRRNDKRTRLRSKFGTPEFEVGYRSVLAGNTKNVERTPPDGSLAWLVARYRETTAWQSLSSATKKQRENILRQVIASAGDQPFAKITKANITAGRDRRASTPFQARHFLDTVRGFFRWALDAGLVKADPTAGIKNPSRAKGDGFPPWTEDDVAAYEKVWPVGTRQRVWLDVLLYTGLRRGDAVRLGRQHIRDGLATKTDTVVTLPILPVLSETLAAGPCGDLTFIAGEYGTPLTKESFGNLFRKACRAAGVPGSAHGVRKIAATRAANAGATVAQLEAIFGWQGGTMAALYTRAADRRRLSIEAMSKLENDKRTSIVAPLYEVRHSAEKDK
jgi:integrase